MKQEIINAYKSINNLNFGDSLSVKEVFDLIGNEQSLILELGANCGQTTIEFIDLIPNARIYCFEPDPRAINKFKLLINSPMVSLVEMAIGANNGTVLFNQSSGAEHIDPQGWDHSGSIRKPKAHLDVWPWVKFDNQIPVPMMRLDDWAFNNHINNVDFIWADVQGAESDLVVGAQDVLSRTRFFYTEFSDDEWYEGQINFVTLSACLPGFSLLHKFSNDALFVSNIELSNSLDNLASV
jgi:FkbM family methyltransferase